MNKANQRAMQIEADRICHLSKSEAKFSYCMSAWERGHYRHRTIRFISLTKTRVQNPGQNKLSDGRPGQGQTLHAGRPACLHHAWVLVGLAAPLCYPCRRAVGDIGGASPLGE